MQAPKTDLNLNLLAEHVARRSDISIVEAKRVIIDTLDVIALTISSGHIVRISNFGVFGTRTTPEHNARNPQTGGRVRVPEKTNPSFKFTGRLRKAVQTGVLARTVRKDPNSR